MNSKAYFRLLDHLNTKHDEHGIWLVGCMVNGDDPDTLQRSPHFPPPEKRLMAGGSPEVASKFRRTGEPLDCGPPLAWLVDRGYITAFRALQLEKAMRLSAPAAKRKRLLNLPYRDPKI